MGNDFDRLLEVTQQTDENSVVFLNRLQGAINQYEASPAGAAVPASHFISQLTSDFRRKKNSSKRLLDGPQAPIKWLRRSLNTQKEVAKINIGFPTGLATAEGYAPGPSLDSCCVGLDFFQNLQQPHGGS